MPLFDLLFGKKLSGGSGEWDIQAKYMSGVPMTRDTMTELTIGSGITALGENAFSTPGNLQKLTFGADIKSIGNNAFRGCTKLTAIELPPAIETIGEYAFYQCFLIKSLKIPGTVKKIAQYAFADCLVLVTIDMTDFDGSFIPDVQVATVFKANPHPAGFEYLFQSQAALNAFAADSKWSYHSSYFKVVSA